MHAAGPSSDDSLPPGFESLQPTSDLKIDMSQIALIRWRCPPQVIRACNLEHCILLLASCQGDIRSFAQPPKSSFFFYNCCILWLQILYNPDWCVAAGEESEEVALQNERMFGALEAIYPRPSNIPPK
jgi:hypothetical protein